MHVVNKERNQFYQLQDKKQQQGIVDYFLKVTQPEIQLQFHHTSQARAAAGTSLPLLLVNGDLAELHGENFRLFTALPSNGSRVRPSWLMM